MGVVGGRDLGHKAELSSSSSFSSLCYVQGRRERPRQRARWLWKGTCGHRWVEEWVGGWVGSCFLCAASNSSTNMGRRPKLLDPLLTRAGAGRCGPPGAGQLARGVGVRCLRAWGWVGWVGGVVGGRGVGCVWGEAAVWMTKQKRSTQRTPQLRLPPPPPPPPAATAPSSSPAPS